MQEELKTFTLQVTFTVLAASEEQAWSIIDNELYAVTTIEDGVKTERGITEYIFEDM